MSFKKILIIVGICIVVLAGAAFAYSKYTKTDGYKQKVAAKQAAQVISGAGKRILLPEGEPSIFVVQDPELLASQQAFFKGAIKGDQLLVYPQAGKAVIYSPSRDIIVNSGPVTFDDQQKQQAPQ